MDLRKRLQRFLIRSARRLNPRPDPQITIAEQRARIQVLELLIPQREERENFLNFMAHAGDMIEARLMAGAGPWRASDGVRQAQAALTRIKERALGLRESNPLASQGAFGDIELALQNVEWRREVNLSWLEFSRWGIQQIILISRLYYIKNPIIRRLIDICAVYVFGRGFEVSSSDETANETLKEFFQRNSRVLGQVALTKLERRKGYDGNLFFALFADAVNSGKVSCRMMDATEIDEIICDPNDSETPWYYKRCYWVRDFDVASGQQRPRTTVTYYPALEYDPDEKPAEIAGYPVDWNLRIYHRKCGEVAQWAFGCPLIYPALDWAKSSREFLESCKTFAKALGQFAFSITTKGGQQAIEGIKQQLETTVSANSASLWDTNPPPVNASTWVSGSGTELAAMTARGKGIDPEEVRRYLLMCCMVVGVPETFLADVSTGNLATATTLDRPTELVFLEKQEAWREDLAAIAQYVLRVSAKAPSGRLAEAARQHKSLTIREAYRKILPDGRMVYEQSKPEPGVIEVKVTFPAIREGDIPQLVAAVADAMTLGNKGGQVVGIDEKAGVRKLYEIVGIDNGDELTEDQYPDSEYDPDRTKEPLPPPIQKLGPAPAGTIPGQDPGAIRPGPATEAARRLARAVALMESDD